jgi:hypothetical protein
LVAGAAVAGGAVGGAVVGGAVGGAVVGAAAVVTTTIMVVGAAGVVGGYVAAIVDSITTGESSGAALPVLTSGGGGEHWPMRTATTLKSPPAPSAGPDLRWMVMLTASLPAMTEMPALVTIPSQDRHVTPLNATACARGVRWGAPTRLRRGAAVR